MLADGLIFDLDGTLVDTNPIHVRTWHRAFGDLGYAVTPEQISRQIGKGGEELVPALIGDDAARKDSQQLRDTHTRLYLEALDRESVQPFTAARKILEYVYGSGYRCAIATAAKQDEIQKVAERSGLPLFDLADAVTTSTDVENTKPHPDVVQVAVEQLGLSATRCVMIGDTIYDVEAALKAGVPAVGITTGYWSEQELRGAGATAVFEDLATLLRDLDNLTGRCR